MALSQKDAVNAHHSLSITVKAQDFSEVSISFRCVTSVVLIFIQLKRSLIFKEQVSIIL